MLDHMKEDKKKKPSEVHLTFCSKISEKMKLLLSVVKNDWRYMGFC